MKSLGLKRGTKNYRGNQVGWIDEQGAGSEMIIRKSDNAILTRLQANDAVVPANLTDNLWKWGAISPDKFISKTNNEMKPHNLQHIDNNINVTYGSLLTVNGNVDKDALPGL